MTLYQAPIAYIFFTRIYDTDYHYAMADKNSVPVLRKPEHE